MLNQFLSPWGWSNDSARRACCWRRGPEFNSQCPNQQFLTTYNSAPGDPKPFLPSEGNIVTCTDTSMNIFFFKSKSMCLYKTRSAWVCCEDRQGLCTHPQFPLLQTEVWKPLLLPLPICIGKLLIFIEKPRKSEPAGQACGGSQGQRELFVLLQFYF